MNMEIGTVGAQFLFWEYFQFSLLVLCSSETILSKVLIFSGVQYLKKAFLPLLVLAETNSHVKF
jgi:hypothetical protein